MPTGLQLLWFRQDVRIHDHAALWHATQHGATVALVTLSPEQWRIHHDAPIKIDFYLRQLQQLKLDLAALNIPLLVLTCPKWSDIAQPLLQLAQQLKATHLHYNFEFGVHEQQRDTVVTQLFEQNAINVTAYQDRTFFPAGSIRSQTGTPYQVFTPFKKNCYAAFAHSLPQCYPIPEAQQALDLKLDAASSHIPQLRDFGYADIPAAQQELWPVTEAAADARLHGFIAQQVKQYHQTRDFPAVSGTSQLSAYLNIGILSGRQCLNALFAPYHGQWGVLGEGEMTWLDELLWREFYSQLLFDFPKLSMHRAFQPKTENVTWRNAPEDLAAWQQGQTGIPIVDAGMRQLLQTGWMHNRVRMVVAMFLTKNLLIDWREGETWFMQHLIDGDLAANNGGWQWSASTGTDAAPYFRVFNPISQSQKFDADGAYIRQYVPELKGLDAKMIHEPYAKNPNLRLDYPKPIVDLKSSRVRAIDAFKQLV